MVRALADVKDLASIQIISHGAESSLTLGSAALNLETVNKYQSQLAAIGASLSTQGDIQLYGCDVAQGVKGEQFVQAIATLTQADVAASKDLTGASAQGGNWTLEYSVGHIDTSVLVPANYSHTLASANVFFNDENGSSYQWMADGVAISGAASSSLTLGQAQVGKAITVSASYTNSLDTAESVTSAATASVARVNSLPVGSVSVALPLSDVLSLDFEGAGNAFPFGSGVTLRGAVAISTIQKVGGNASAYFDGNGSSLQFNLSALNIGAVDFSIDFDFKTDGPQNPWSVLMSSATEGGWGQIANGTAGGGKIRH
jgi:hypothetical protein